jgi:hypothetical protein
MNKLVATGLVLMAAGAATADMYTDEGAFVAQLGNYYLEEFDFSYYGLAGGDPSYSLGPVNGFAYDITASPNGVWGGDGNFSHATATDLMTLTMTGDPVYAIGGFFFGSDISGFYIAESVTVMTSDGQSHTWLPDDPYGGSPDFLGFTSNVPIISVTIDADDTFQFAWSTVDHFYVGNLIPAPASIALLGLAGLLRRR